MRSILTFACAVFLTTGFASAQATSVEICLFEEEDWAANLAACNEALANSDDPVEQGRFILHRGIAHENLGDLDAALLDQILVGEYRPDWHVGYSNAAYLSSEMGNAEAEFRWAQAAIDAEPDNPRAYASMLTAHNNSDTPENCAPYADLIIERLHDPIDWPFDVADHEYLMGNLGFCLYTLERHDEALQALQAADYMGLEEGWFYEDLASLAYYALERDEIALDAATRALATGAPEIESVHILIRSSLYLGRYEAALAAEQTYSDLLDAEDLDYSVRNNIAWTLFIEGDLETAGAVIDRWHATYDASDTTPNEAIANTLDTLAHINAARGDAEGAMAAFTAAVARESEQFDDLRRETYRNGMEALGITVGEGEAGLFAGLAECVAMGAECRLIFEDDETAQAAEAE